MPWPNNDPEWRAKHREARIARIRARNASPEWQAKAHAAQAGRPRPRDTWKCPPGFEALYPKVRGAVGALEARRQIEALAKKESQT